MNLYNIKSVFKGRSKPRRSLRSATVSHVQILHLSVWEIRRSTLYIIIETLERDRKKEKVTIRLPDCGILCPCWACWWVLPAVCTAGSVCGWQGVLCTLSTGNNPLDNKFAGNPPRLRGKLCFQLLNGRRRPSSVLRPIACPSKRDGRVGEGNKQYEYKQRFQPINILKGRHNSRAHDVSSG